jgi:hypothetical protein
MVLKRVLLERPFYFKCSKSSATHGSSPTTQASCPGPTSNASPGRTVITLPSAPRTAIRPERTYPMWASEVLPVCSPTCRDHRHPGRYSPRPIATDSSITAVRLLPSRNVRDLSPLSSPFAKGSMNSWYLIRLAAGRRSQSRSSIGSTRTRAVPARRVPRRRAAPCERSKRHPPQNDQLLVDDRFLGANTKPVAPVGALARDRAIAGLGGRSAARVSAAPAPHAPRQIRANGAARPATSLSVRKIDPPRAGSAALSALTT